MEERCNNTGDLWMDKARSLQLRVRERFRVAVDRQRHRPRFYYRSYFSSTLERWLLRFHNFRRDSLPSSTFYHKRVSKDVDEEGSILTRVLQAVAVPVIGNVCHVFMHGLNRVQIYGAEKLHEALLHRGKNKPLITVSNHVASMDDPLVIASLLPPSVLFDAHSLRWTLCASDRCFRNPATSAFFKCVKVLPISRGEGIYQKGMDVAISKLNQGGWVHIFPEGTRSRDGGKTMGSVKRGIGRLVLDADAVPLVIPFVHTGMQEIMPVGAKIPRIGKTITVVIGDPIEFEDLRNAEKNHNLSRGKLYDAVSARIGDRLKKLKDQVDRLAIEKPLQLQNYSWKYTEQVAGILQNIDWEALGMHSYMGADADSLSLQKNSPNETGRNGVLNLQENDSPDQYFGTGFSYGGGIVSRIQGYMDPTEFMGFAARGLFMKREVRENFVSVQAVSPLKAWNNLWKLIYQNCIPI